MRSNLLGLGVDFPRRHGDSRTGHWRGTRTVGAQTVRRCAGVTLFDLDDFRGNAQLGGDDLRVGSLVALALRDGAHACNRATGGVHADFAGVEHAHTQDVADFARAGTHHFGESDQTDAHQGAAMRVSTFGRLLSAQAFVVDRVEHLVQRGLVVARIVVKAQRGVVGKLFALDEVFGADFGLVHAEFLRQHVDHALDQVHRLGDPEGAAVGHATGRFVGVDAVDLAIGVGDVVAAGADMEHAGREFGRVGAGVKRAVVGNHIGAQCEDLAVSGGGQFTGHVVVAGKAGGGQILDAVFHPLDRAAQHDGGHDGADIAGINRHLVAKAAADVGRDDAHLGLGDARKHGHHGAHDVRRLAGEVGGEFAADRIERRDRATGL